MPPNFACNSLRPGFKYRQKPRNLNVPTSTLEVVEVELHATFSNNPPTRAPSGALGQLSYTTRMVGLEGKKASSTIRRIRTGRLWCQYRSGCAPESTERQKVHYDPSSSQSKQTRSPGVRMHRAPKGALRHRLNHIVPERPERGSESTERQKAH